MDPLTDVLQAMKLSGGVFLDAGFTAPWCISARVDPEDCRPYMAVPRHVIAYHLILRGRAEVGLASGEVSTATAGQLLVMPRNDEHRLGSDVGLPPERIDGLIEPPADGGLASIRYGGGGERTDILCGFLGSDEPESPLLASLPAVMTLDLNSDLAGPWVEGSMRYAAKQLAAGGPGASASLARLAELLLAEGIRAHLATLPEEQTGWLGGLRDPVVGRALAIMHGRPEAPLTLEGLASEVGHSRSVLAARFRRHIGMSPMRYFNRRRLLLAAERLRREQRPAGAIGHDVGYESEAAFNRAFKREFGMAPGEFRKKNSGVPG